MIQTGFEPRVKVQEIITNQLPSFILDENPKAVDFFKQYYISQEYQGGTSDLSENLDQYLKVDNLVPEVIVDSTKTVGVVTTGDATINVNSTKGFPDTYGLLKINNEIITYTGITTNSFTGCIRGFCGITSYHQQNNAEELVFSTSTAAQHTSNAPIQNLSVLFLKEFYRKLKSTFTPGLEDVDFTPALDAGNFIKEARSLYEAKGTNDSFKILCKVLYGVDPEIVNLEDYLIKPSSAKYLRRYVTIAEVISGDPIQLIGQSITKSTDAGTNASVSEVEPFTRNNQQYFKVSLFIGNDDLSTIQGTFNITPATKATELVSVGSSVLPVDSTIGFAQTGYVISGVNSVTYLDKSVNQFFGCTGIGVSIQPADNVRSDETYFGYEGGDATKKVVLRLTGVLSEFKQISKKLNVKENDIIGVKNLGSNIKNPDDKTYKQIFANSWIYNTSSRYQIDDVSNYTLGSPIDRSSLKKGDRVEILQRDSEEVGSSKTSIAHVASVVDSENRVTLDNLTFTSATGQDYDLRRKLNTASSSNATLLYGNDTTLSDVLNVYDENGEYAYVASNSLPSSNQTTATTIDYAYEISKEVNTVKISSGSVGILTDGSTDGLYRTLKFPNAVPFIEGDRIFYQPDVAPLVGLETGSYYVSIVSTDKKQIKLYSSRSFVGGSNFLKFAPQTDGHRFTLFSQRSNVIGPQKILKKFSLNPNIKNGKGEETTPGTTGMLINGVEISNYKSDDKIYYGPVEKVTLLNGGSGYDVINLPVVTATNSSVSGGTTAVIQPVISGSFEKVYVDPQEFDIQNIVSIGITGGNGTGAVLEAKTADRFRNVFFDARKQGSGGGINTVTDQIVFNTDHNFVGGEEIIYNTEGNTTAVGFGTTTLVNTASYFAKIDNNRTIQLFETITDYNAGINTVNLTDGGNGTQKFSPAKSKRTITSIEVVNGGSGYTNRNLIVKPVGINTQTNSVDFVNHGFLDGDTIEYVNHTGTAWTSLDIVGLVSSFTYRVLKTDDNSFRIANIGVAGTDMTKYEQREFVRFDTVGTGAHNFKFPDITVSVQYTSVGFGTTTQEYQTINAVPVVRGSIIDSYLCENGTGYGSTILNHHQRPLISITSGKDGGLDPFIVNGKIESVTIDSGGSEYTSLPDVEVIDPTGVGIGADIRPVIANGRLVDAIIVNAGIGYSTDTSIRVRSTGINALYDADVRSLSVINNERFENELLQETDDKLQYSVLGYFDTLRTAFGEDSSTVSKIIGWAYDGNPIYGPYGYAAPADTNSSATRVRSGYTLNSANVVDRPSAFTDGFFAEDYQYTNTGDLDEYNGRFAKTAEFPNGVYAYYATINSSNSPEFPFFIGNKYRSNTLPENKALNQKFDFNSSDLLRNTFPYKVSDAKADNDFIIETQEIVNQKSIVEGQSKGSVTGFDLVNRGDGYKVNDTLNFELTDEGGGLISKISEIQGKPLNQITTTVEEFANAVFTLESDSKIKVTIKPHHSILNGENIVISGFSTSLTELNDNFVAGVTSYRSSLTEAIISGTAGVTTEIYVANIPESVSVGSSITIGSETCEILEVFNNLNVLKIERGLTGVAHTATSVINFKPNSLTIDSPLEFFDSKVNDKVYFNPHESVGVGTTAGVFNTVTFQFGSGTVTRDIPTKSIILENHPFENNQPIRFTTGGATISISTSSTSGLLPLPANAFVVKKNINTIGIKTTLDSSEVFFRSNGSNSDLYSFESDFNQILGKVQKVKTQVSVSTFHELRANDLVSLNVNPSLSVGVGTDAAVIVKRNVSNGNIHINPFSFTSAAIDTAKNIITINDHGLKTGDKIDYDAEGFTFVNQTYSDGVTSSTGAFASAAQGPAAMFDGNKNSTFCTASTTGATIVWEPVEPIVFTSTLKVARTDAGANSTVTFVIDGTTQTHTIKPEAGLGFPFQQIWPSGGTLTRMEFSGGGIGGGISAIEIDGAILEDPYGLSPNTYFVYRVDDDRIQLCVSSVNVSQDPPVVVDIKGTGPANQSISPINPRIKSIKDNNLVFDLADVSLQDHKLKIYYDNEYNNEIVSISTTGKFTIVGYGTAGVTVGAALTITHNQGLPRRLYYNLEKGGYISTTDKEVSNYSEILFTNSAYVGEYEISPIGFTSTAFNVFLSEIPERLSYASTECNTLTYNTKSTSATGPISKINIISGGSNYEKVPVFSGVTGSNGLDASIVPTSDAIGNAESVRVINEGFEYSSDKTLQPTADIDDFITIKDSNTVGIVSIISGGKNYITAPTIAIVNSNTRKKIDTGLLVPTITSNAITEVTIEDAPKGLPEKTVELFTENNTNGVSIQKVFSNNSIGIITCHITTPTIGFPVDPFKIGDKVFLEGVTQYTSTGTGYNSKDIGYRFYTVTNYDKTSGVLDRVTLDGTAYIASGSAGIANTDQGAVPVMIKEDDYPNLLAIQVRSDFLVGEKLVVGGSERDLAIASFDETTIKVTGSYELKVGDVITGSDSGNKATIDSIVVGEGRFDVDYKIQKNIGWETNIGMLSLDNQVVSDNDYYQNLSYSIKSPLTYQKTTEVIKGMLHTTGTKDFADTGITSEAPAGVGSRKNGDLIGDKGVDDETSIFRDVIEEVRVDTLYDFDLVRDIDVSNDKSKFIEFKNKRLTDYIDCRTNRVLTIDNINSQFSNLDGDPSQFATLINFDSGRTYYNIIARVANTSGTEVSLTEFVVLNSDNDFFIVDKGEVVNDGVDLLHNNGEELGTFSVNTDAFGDSTLRFTPTEPLETDYDLKLRVSEFSSSSSGIGTVDFGVVKLVGSNGITTATGITTTVYSGFTTSTTGLFADVQVIDKATNEMNFVSAYLSHDGTDTFLVQSFSDTNASTNALTVDEIGEFSGDIVSGMVSFNYTSNKNNNVEIRSRIVGFGTTGMGAGTHRFKSTGQASGSERSVIYTAGFTTNTTVSVASSILSINNNLFNAVKSCVQVSVGSSSALHQVMMVRDNNQDVYLQQSGYLSANSATGLGTFGTNINSGHLSLEFTPDTANTEIKVFSECFYEEQDSLNIPLPLSINSITENIRYNEYNAINGDRINKTKFRVTHKGIPIFAKTFNPGDTNVLDLSTGKFSINDHFFQNGEQLNYIPGATFAGVGSTAMQYRSSAGVEGVVPDAVFAIVGTDPDSFHISTTRAGTAITFTSVGEGNSHMLEMYKKNSKSLITIDNIAQYPVTHSSVSHTFGDNGGSIGIGSTLFALSGISTISPNDVLRVNDEFMIVQNVGFGTTNAGPISNSGSVGLVLVERGAIGSAASTHQDATGVATVFKGGYNLVGQDIHFTQPPRGNPQIETTDSNLPFPTSHFNGRAYLRQDYTTNRVYDDVSDKFTGIGQTFTLSVGGANTAGIGTTGGNGILFINGIFQTPTTQNNPSNNFKIIENNSVGVSSVVFSGIRDQSNNIFTSAADVNIGQLPRGGMIVSLGSSGGLGYAPLDGAIVAPTIGANGRIGSVVVGFGSTSDIKNVTDGYMISTATYNASTGVLEVTTEEPHKFTKNTGEVFMEGLHFECAAQHAGVTTTIFPDGSSPFGQRFPLLGITSATTFTANVGICTIPHNYVGFGSVYSFLSDLSVGSGYRDWAGGVVSVAVTDLIYPHRFVSAGVNSITDNTGTTHTATDAEYDSPTGILKLTIPNHGLTDANTIGIATDSLVFTCSRDNYQTNHAYPRAVSLTRKRRGETGGDPAHNVNLGITTFTANTLSVGVGSGGGAGSGATINHVVGAGGTLGFSVGTAGTEYVNPHIDVSEPTYENLEIAGVSRLGIGATTDTGIGCLLDITVGASSTTGIGSTYHAVTGFEIARSGYSFRRGDVFRPVGLVTALHRTTPLEDYTLTVLDIFTDNFGSWQFGEIDYIDSIKNFQDGSRKRFPLFYNNDLLSFEAETDSDIDLAAALLIIIDGVIQEPGVAYEFDGGTTFSFTAPPLPEANIDVFFYRGTRGTDTVLITGVNQLIEKGDQVQILKNNANRSTRSQGKRRVYNLDASDKIETNVYIDAGINEEDYKPISVIKQKVDLTLNGEKVYKTRDSLEGQVFPVAKIIGDFSTTDTEIFLENTDLFDYGSPVSIGFMAVAGIGSTDAVSNVEFISGATNIQGFSGIITGITTTTGTGSHPLALEFTLKQASFPGLSVGYPIVISDTTLGTGATSVFNSNTEVVSIGQTFLDNVYNISALHVNGTAGIITCNIDSGSPVTGLSTFGDDNNPVGTFSWGRLSGFSRGTSPISIGVTGLTVPSVTVGISTFPIVQRRGVGLRETGSLPKQL